MPKLKDLTGRTFGRLEVVERTTSERGYVRWMCRCECGGTTVVRRGNLLSGHTTSCGCKQGESWRTHGQSRGRDYQVWENMRLRCRNPKATGYARYGGRGIRVCDRWDESFEAFLEDMGPCPSPRHTIDRIDNDGDYTPDNCRWSTRMEQGQNRCNNHRVSFGGETLPVSEWARRTGISPQMIGWRIRNGWPAEKALTVIPGSL